MLSKAKLKFIHSLELKKNRKAAHAFVAEGPKVVTDLQEHYICRMLIATEEWIKAHSGFRAEEIITVTPEELTRASFLKTPQEVMAVFGYEECMCPIDVASEELCLALDDVQDPGNLGTIIRVADWFGIHHIFCSHGTVDVYNPKVVQATMGALARVKVHYTDLPDVLGRLTSRNIPIYGTFLDGEDMYEKSLTTHGIIVMGNEGNGVGEATAAHINERLFIPNYPIGVQTSESLNVAMATGIVCAEFRRRMRE